MNEIVDACRRGDAEKFKQLFSQADNHKQLLESRDKEGRKLIHYAAEGGSKQIVSIILEKGGNGQAAIETRHDTNTPLNIALMSEKPSAPAISSLLLEKMRELGFTPRRNRQGNYPLHIACESGHIDQIQALHDAFPDTMYTKNVRGYTPLGCSVWKGKREAVSFILDRASPGPPTQFDDFSSHFPSYTTIDRQLDPPIDVFVLGDNRCGKSSFIRSIESEKGIDKFWGVAYNTLGVTDNKIGLVPTDFTSKKYGRVIFHDLASGANYVNIQLVHTPEEIERSVFAIVIDSRPDRKEMERKLEFWLNIVHQQCKKVSQDTAAPAPHPTVMILSSHWDYFKAFRNPNEVRLDYVCRKVARINRELVSSMNIISRQSMDCRKAQSHPISQIRQSLKTFCKQQQKSNDPVNYRCYVLSNIFAEIENELKEQDVPMMTLEDLSRKIEEKSAEPTISLYNLVPSDLPQLLELCQMLESRKRIILLRNVSFGSDEDIMIVYGLQRLAGLIDSAFLDLQPLPGRPPNPTIALKEREELQDFLSQKLSISADLIVQILDCLKIHSLSIPEEFVDLTNDQPIYFLPTLLPDSEIEKWEETPFCFAWSYKPVMNQLYRYFMPTYKNSLLVVLYDLCDSMEIDFDYRKLWQGGINFRHKEQIEICVMVTSNAVTLNMRYQQTNEIAILHLRNRILHKIRALRETFQPEMETEESIIPSNGAAFPVRSPTSPRLQYNLKELKQSISTSTLNLASSMVSLPLSSSSHTPPPGSGHAPSVESQDPLPLPFFEPCLSLHQLETISRQYIMLREHADKELTDSLLYDLRRCFGPTYYRMFEEHFNLPPITITPTASVPGSVHSDIEPMSPASRFHHARAGSLHHNCNTNGKLADCLDSISIFNTAVFLTDVQRAEVSRGAPSTPTSYSVSIDRRSSQSSDRSTATPQPDSSRLFPFTTRPVSATSSKANLSNVYFVDQIQVFTCGPEGGVFHSAQNGITIKFPKGAVPDHSSVTIEFGVALNGPFDIPKDSKPVSPFMWFCTDTPDFVFLKPLEITLPHFMSLDKSDCSKLTFMKANHKNGEDEYVFKESTDQMKFKKFSNHGVLFTNHTCFLCITANIPESMISRAKYCLIKVAPKSYERTFELKFFLTYYLETCMEAVQRQINCDENEVQRDSVNIATSLDPDPEISIGFENYLPKGWIATNHGGDFTIPISSIEFWSQDLDHLRLMNQYGSYPPRFTIKVSGAEATGNTIMDVKFQGLRRPKHFQFQLNIDTRSLNRDPSENSIGSIPPGSPRGSVSGPHPLDRIITDLVRYLEVDQVRLQLCESGTFTDDEYQKLVDLSTTYASRATKVETLVGMLKRKGDDGLAAFKNALEKTTNGTGHETILRLLRDS